MRALKLAGLVTCSLALSAATAAAAPQVLDDAALDGVVAGAPGSFSQSYTPGFPQRPSLGFPSVIPTPAPAPALSIPLETATPVEADIDGVGTSSTSITTGEEAAIAAADPAAYVRGRLPIFPVFPTTFPFQPFR